MQQRDTVSSKPVQPTSKRFLALGAHRPGFGALRFIGHSKDHAAEARVPFPDPLLSAVPPSLVLTTCRCPTHTGGGWFGIGSCLLRRLVNGDRRRRAWG